jgi:hypothetical protein
VSTFAYAAITARREASSPGKSMTEQPPAMKTYIDVLAALVPAEVLAAHAAVLTFTTKSIKGADGKTATTITDPTSLKVSFWGLIAVSVVLYVAGHAKSWDGWDFLRVAIPPVAFAGWCMAQRTTAFDSVASWSLNTRSVIAIIGALALGAVATALSYKADQK